MQYYLGGADAATLAYVASQVSAVQKALTISGLAAPDPRTTEDCLFLDVISPKAILENKSGKKAPVLVWIYGGGYVGGDKSLSGNPATLISRSFENRGEGLVFVTFNYRLGLFVSTVSPYLLEQPLISTRRVGSPAHPSPKLVGSPTPVFMTRDLHSNGFRRTFTCLEVMHLG